LKNRAKKKLGINDQHLLNKKKLILSNKEGGEEIFEIIRVVQREVLEIINFA